jgi:lipopolysaccharide export system permease protein
MSTIDLYLARHINQAILAIVLTLATLISLFGLYEELDEPAVTYGLQQSARFILTTLPRRLDEVLIYSVFLGFLVAMGRLAETNELTAIRTAGHSPTRLILACAPSILLWVLINIGITEFIAPNADRRAEIDKMQAKFGVSEEGIEVALWLRVNNLFMRVQAIDENGDIWGVTQYRVDERNALTEMLASARGHYDPAAARWILTDVSRTHVGPEGAAAEKLDQFVWDNPITPELLASKAFLDPNKMSLSALYQQLNFEGNTAVSEHNLAFWSRVLRPLSYFSLCLLALAAVIGPLREVSASVRVTVGIFVGLGFKYLQDLLAPAAIVFQIPAWLGVLLPIALCITISIYLLKRHA